MVSISTLTSGVSKVVDMIQMFLPLIGVGGQATQQIDKIIDTMQEFAPLIVDQVDVTYTGVKEIIKALSSNPETTAEQLRKLKEFDKKVDDAWDEIEGELDPDKPKPA